MLQWCVPWVAVHVVHCSTHFAQDLQNNGCANIYCGVPKADAPQVTVAMLRDWEGKFICSLVGAGKK